MTEISKAKAKCGHCGKWIDIEWEIVDISVDEGRPMGESAEYRCEAHALCEACGKEYELQMIFCEYPVGVIEGQPSVLFDENDPEPLNNIELPTISFYDI